jgi:hypothetical protein
MQDRKDRKLIKCWWCPTENREVFHSVKQASEWKPEQKDDNDSQQ